MIATKRRLASLGLLAGIVVLLALTLPVPLTPQLRTRLTASLGERFNSQVDLKSLHVSVFPRVRVTGRGLVLRHQGRTDVPPLVAIEEFSADATLLGLLARPLRLKDVHLQRLEINIPPGGLHIDKDKERKERKRSPIVVDHLQSERAVLTILRRDPGKQPRLFEIHRLAMQGTGSDEPWPFEAVLTNPKPPGEIRTRGRFGPWDAADPASTRLRADYEFRNADLGVFDAILGILNSTGTFAGTLDRIEVDGRTSVPAFALEDVGHAVPLETTFHSIVDGTNGNTLLQPVNARLLQTTIVTNGGVVERPGEDGRTVSLDVVVHDGRLEDLLRLAVKTDEPPMTGTLRLKATFVLPPGHIDAMEKLRLDGSFDIATARFTKGDVQAKVNLLSEKGQGKTTDAPETVASKLKGTFSMRRGVIHLSGVSFEVTGARIDVAGDYTLRSAALDFRGTVRLNAPLSKTTDGVKSFLLSLVEPVFRRNHRTVIPIKISGSARDPKVGLDLGGLF